MKNGPPRPGRSRRSYHAITMERLAGSLSSSVEGPVVDMTGLTGKYDVDLETWQDTPEEPGATIFDAVAKLGLKLESRKVTVETVVVDRVSKAPTAN